MAAMRLFGTSGVRGVYNREIDCGFAYRLGLAIATHFGGGRAVVGWDCRASSGPLAMSLASGLMDAGSDVDLSNVTSTPALQNYMKVRRGSYRFGVMVTASHNPPEYNGFKVYTGDGLEAYEDVEDSIESILRGERFSRADLGSLGSLRHIGEEPNERYVDSVCGFAEEGVERYSVVADLCGCSMIKAIPHVLGRLGVRHWLINDRMDGLFRFRPAEPRPDNITALVDAVKSRGADLGVAFDGDGDRAIFVDEKGQAWWGDMTGILIAKYMVEVGETKYVVTPITSTAATEIVVEEAGGKVVRTKVGAKNIVRKMIEVGSVWGFEENGGGIYGKHIYGRDGGITLLMVLRVMKHYGKSLSQLLSELPRLYQVKDKVSLPDRSVAPRVIEALKEEYSRYEQDLTEGVKIFFKDTEWVLVRPSGTEPIMRIFGESESPRRAREIVEEMKAKVLRLISE